MSSERNTTYQASKALWLKWISYLNVEVKFYWEGVETPMPTAFCYLEHHNQLLVKGVGKGIQQSQVELSACYEALENYLASHHLYPRSYENGSVKNISKSFNIVPMRYHSSLLKNHLSQVLPWVIAAEYRTNEKYAVPFATVDLSYSNHKNPEDNFDYSPYDFYASTNGLVCAASYDEALIHGISETLERDALSYFMFDTFIIKKPIIKISNQSLPNYLQEIVCQLEIKYSDEIHLIKLPSRHGVPAYAATFTKQPFQIQPAGFGASLNAAYAAERAILEALQMLHVYNHLSEECIDLTKTRLRQFPVLFNCLRFNLIEIISAGYFVSENFQDTSYKLTEIGVKPYLKILIDKIYQHHSIILIDTILAAEDGLTCLNVLIPGMEEFCHISNEAIMLPLKESQDYIEKAQAELYISNAF